MVFILTSCCQIVRVKRKRGERERNNFDFACAGGRERERERDNLMRPRLYHRHLIHGMDVTTLAMFLRPIFTLT